MGEGPVYLLFVYLCGGDGGGEPRWTHSQDSPPRGEESSKFRTTLTAAQPRDRKPTAAAAAVVAAAAAAAAEALGPSL